MGSVLTFEARDTQTGAAQLSQDFVKFFSSRCHVTFCGAGEHRIGSQMTEIRGQRGRTTVSRRKSRPLPATRLKTVVKNAIRLLASFGRVFAQFFQKPQQCQPFVF
jgi:hypothetical protein